MEDREIINSLNKKLESLNKEKAEAINLFDKKISSIENTILVLKGETISTEKIKKTDKTLRAIVLECVTNDIKDFESANTITNLIIAKYFPDMTESKKVTFKAQVSNLLSFWKKKGKIFSHQFGNTRLDSKWGKIEWQDQININTNILFQ
jgi:hypothetical protein